MRLLQKNILLVLLLLVTSVTFGQWQQLQEPEGGSMGKIIEIGTKLFVESDNGGLYSSIDNGMNWSFMQNNLPVGYNVISFYKENDILFLQLQTLGKGLYISTDLGETWTISNLDFDQPLQISAITTNGTKLFLSVETGIYDSIDGGLNWNFKPFSQIEGFTYDILFFDNKLFRAERKIYVSDDEGTSWTETPFVPGPNGIRHLFVQNNRVFIENNASIYSTDDFETFEFRYYERFTALSMKSFDNTIYITHSNGEYKYSNDNGVTWNTVVVDTIERRISDIQKVGSKLVVSGKVGMFESFDNGTNWASNNSGILATFNSSISSNGTDLISSVSGVGIIKSTDQGISWVELNGNLPINEITVNSFQDVRFVGENIVAVYGKKIYLSNDNGLTYNISYEEDPVTSIKRFSYDGNRLIAFLTNSEVIISEDDGETWVSRDVDGFEISSTTYQSPVLDGDTIIYPSKDNNLLISNDLGLTWSEKELDMGIENIRGVQLYNDKLYIRTTGKLYESTSTGENLQVKIMRLLDAPVYDFKILGDKMYFFGRKISVAKIGGDFTYDISANLEGRFVADIALINNSLFITTGGFGFWKGPVQEVPQDTDNDGVADSDDNCPNTPEGTYVDSEGCTSAQLDDDGDGVFNDRDTCENTPTGLEVNSSGCADSELDSDNDGVTDDLDQCPFATTPGSNINEFGCEIIASNSIQVLTRTPTCPNATNGMLEISTDLPNIFYNVGIVDSNNEESNFGLTAQSSPLLVDNLAAGTYTVRVVVSNTAFDFTYTAIVNELETVNSGKRALDVTKKTVSYEVSGSKTYNVSHNGNIREFRFESTTSNTLELNVSDSINDVVIKGENECQGKIEDKFTLEEEILIFPTITSGLLSVSGGMQRAEIYIYNTSGQLMSKAKMQVNNDNSVNLDEYPSGLYIIHIKTEESTKVFKVIKK